MDRDGGWNDARTWSAGVAAIVAACAWLTWAVSNMLTHGAPDGPRTGPSAPWAWLGAALLVASTALVIPAALVLGRRLRALAPKVVPLATAAGVLSLSLWAMAAATGWWPAGLEVGFLALSAGWWGGIAVPLRRVSRRLGTLTFVLAIAAACDTIVTGAGERLPGWMFPVLGGAKLPLQLIWTASVGVVLVRARRLDASGAATDASRIRDVRTPRPT